MKPRPGVAQLVTSSALTEWLDATLTGNCEDSPDCKEVFAGPKCDAYGRCIFPNGVKESLKKRVMAAPLAGTMSSTEESERKTMETNTKKQSPRNNYILSAASAAGVPPDSVCFSDSDCAGYPLSYCDGICRCVRGSLNAGSTCISPVPSVYLFTAGLQNSRTCPTGQAYISEAGACMTVRLPGEPCQYSQQCAAAEPGAFCSRLRCECTYGMKQSGTGCVFIDSECNERGLVFIPEIGECRAVLRPGSQGCSHNLQCSQAFPDARCIQHICTCPSELPAAVDGTCAPRC
ncbi:hypothetical protein RB195_013484 [Necator americanus]|uniref:EB domain-containing protein n=1 Tax=Necator americanus TaxID=51031 RepID=A0ABR1DVP9_NECAM